MLDIFVDADGCPVKQEVVRVARRHGLKVTLVSNSRIHVPRGERIEGVVVKGDFNAADDWIADHVAPGDIVVSNDIPLASRCLAKGAAVLTPAGHVYTEENIGEALAHRNLMSQLREMGAMTGGPAPFQARDRSRFLQRLDEIVRATRRNG